MTIDTIKSRLEEIRRIAGDNERAHSAEDELHQDVLRAIADGDIEPLDSIREAARLALASIDIEFERWSA